jgi:hypothetical protein
VDGVRLFPFRRSMCGAVSLGDPFMGMAPNPVTLPMRGCAALAMWDNFALSPSLPVLAAAVVKAAVTFHAEVECDPESAVDSVFAFAAAMNVLAAGVGPPASPSCRVAVLEALVGSPLYAACLGKRSGANPWCWCCAFPVTALHVAGLSATVSFRCRPRSRASAYSP